MRRWFARPSRIAVRLLAFNLLLLFLPIAGILYLDVYETRLLETQERSMIQQARLIAAALSDREVVDPVSTGLFMTRLGQRGDARFRVYDAGGAVIADSGRTHIDGEPSPAVSAASSYPARSGGVRARRLYRVGAAMVGMRRIAGIGIRRMLFLDRSRASRVDGEPAGLSPEVGAALAGRYGAATRPTAGQRSLTLSSAVSVRRGDKILGAVLVSQSTFRLLQALYDVRLRIFEVVIASLAAAALLTALAAATIVRPIGRLRRQAGDLAERRSRLPGIFRDADRRDEIGDLARALQELTRRLDAHLREVERFASDVAHEFKNPLAAIRTAAEMAAQAEDAGDRARFLGMLTRDADRLERLVSDVRELVRIDAQLEQEPVDRVDVGAVLTQVVDGLRLAHGTEPDVIVTLDPRSCYVRGSADRLAQAFENVVSNARSFAPRGTVIDAILTASTGRCDIVVADRGPGIPAAHLDRIFERFFSYRPGSSAERGSHAGLGLAIARTIVQGYGGTIGAANRPEGGAAFEIKLPLD